jgi:site-specific DNA-methyltransferase (adenine-specific)
MDGKNKLYFGDNLKILRDYVADASVDLIYLDPPFNSSATYNVLFKKDVAQGPLSGPAAFQVFPAAQIMAFEDTSVAPLYERRRWGLEPEAVYKEIVTSGPRKPADLMEAISYADRMQREQRV